jgi:hypothetical protein
MRLSEADPAAVRQYLVGRQIAPEIIDWKYFDTGFNKHRERGVVWLRENQVAGFLGLIPFQLEKEDVRADCAWSCDWSVDSRQGAGTGLLLVKRARELYDGIFNLGGNENTRQLFPRLADRTVPDAGIGLVLPLRVGSIFARFPHGIVRDLLSRQNALAQIPLRWIRRSSENVTIDPGLSPRVAALRADGTGRDWRPRYDSEFFDWQFRRCPAITCWSCCSSSESAPRTAAVIWSPRNSKEFWRLVFLGETNDLQKMKTLIAAIVSFVYSQGCIALFAIVSHQENELLDFLRSRGFLRHGKLPFYVMRGRNAALPTEEFSTLNLLDADLAYRFEGQSGPDRS